MAFEKTEIELQLASSIKLQSHTSPWQSSEKDLPVADVQYQSKSRSVAEIV